MITLSEFEYIFHLAYSYSQDGEKPWLIEELHKDSFIYSKLPYKLRCAVFTIISLMIEYKDTNTIFWYNQFLKLSNKELSKVINSGYQGIVFDLGDKVLKYFPKGFRDNDLKFFRYCQEVNPVVFPNIYRIGKDYVVLEKLNTNIGEINKTDYNHFLQRVIMHFHKFSNTPIIDITRDNIGLRGSQLVIFDI